MSCGHALRVPLCAWLIRCWLMAEPVRWLNGGQTSCSSGQPVRPWPGMHQQAKHAIIQHAANSSHPTVRVQMCEEVSLASLMTILFTLPTYFWVKPGGSFAVLYLTSLISLCDGIGALPRCQARSHSVWAGSGLLESAVRARGLDHCPGEPSRPQKRKLQKAAAPAPPDMRWCTAFAYGTAAISPNMDIGAPAPAGLRTTPRWL